MSPTMKTVYRVALYDADGNLVRHQEGWPAEDNPSVQTTADITAASFQSRLGTGTAVVWEDADTEPPAHLPGLYGPDMAWCAFGPAFPPVPTYRCEVDSETGSILMYPQDAA